MVISWNYSQTVEIRKYDLGNKKVEFKCLSSGASNLKDDAIYWVDFSKEDKVPDIPRVIELIEEQYEIYLGDKRGKEYDISKEHS